MPGHTQVDVAQVIDVRATQSPWQIKRRVLSYSKTTSCRGKAIRTNSWQPPRIAPTLTIQAIILSAGLSFLTKCITIRLSATRLSSTSKPLSNLIWSSEWPIRVDVHWLVVRKPCRPLELRRVFLIPAEGSSIETHRPWSPSQRWAQQPTMALLQQSAQVIDIKRLSTVSCRITILRCTKIMLWNSAKTLIRERLSICHC